MVFSLIDILIFVAFVIAVVATGLIKSRHEKTGEDYFLAGRNMKGWITGISFSLVAINADVALIHAQKVGDQGTVRIEGLRFADVEIARCAKKLVVSCEKIVPESELRQNPDMNCIPFFLVDAIVEVPHGGHPTNCFNYYDYDAQHLNMYAKMAENDKTFKEYLDEWVYGVANHKEYIDKVGAERLAEIKADPSFGFRPGLERRG